MTSETITDEYEAWSTEDRTDYRCPLPAEKEAAGMEFNLELETEYGRLRAEGLTDRVLGVHSHNGRVSVAADANDGDVGAASNFGLYMTPEQARAVAKAMLFAAEAAEEENNADII